ncbi:MAG: peptidyl-prolyl cis-trans isomerase [Verrucomicrobiota bacterium]|jgi:peptidyl-prolyl cis-trans isomerase B (cyclophilin B)|nr:peptidyl-prolyl cis-trans isomerase [Verrucomicrobiota bacterium]
MKNILILSTILLASAVAGLADPVAVFDVQWGKGKDRQKRSFAIGFYDADAPRTSANFKKLVQDGFYKKTTIHRVFPNYLVQGGDPLSKNKDRSAVGTGGPGYTLPAEIRRKHFRGTVAMGRLPNNLNPNRQSNGSQFYVCLAPMPAQDGQDTVFGEVAGGLASLDEISHLPADSNANPVDRVEVVRTYIIDRSQLGRPVKVK